MADSHGCLAVSAPSEAQVSQSAGGTTSATDFCPKLIVPKVPSAHGLRPLTCSNTCSLAALELALHWPQGTRDKRVMQGNHLGSS